MTGSERAGVWAVVKVPYPYTDRATRQGRPALVVAETGSMAGLPLLWVLMITSAENRGWPGDVPVGDLATAGLPAPSVIRTEKIATIDARDVVKLGTLREPDRRMVCEQLHRVLEAANRSGGADTSRSVP